MVRYKFIAVAMLIAIICGCSPNIPPTNNIVLEDISSYHYQRLLGHNAAIAQFGVGNEDLFVNLDNKRVIQYATNEGDVDSGYADGYHRALEMIDRRNNNECPVPH